MHGPQVFLVSGGAPRCSRGPCPTHLSPAHLSPARQAGPEVRIDDRGASSRGLPRHRGPITSGPAPELVEAGYALEIADAPLLHRGLTLADLAHLAELVECGALTRDEAAPVGAVLLKLLDSPAAEFPYDRYTATRTTAGSGN